MKLKTIDIPLVFYSGLLCLIGLIAIYSSCLSRGDFSSFQKQIIFIIAGFALMLSLSLFDWRIFKDNPYLILILYFLNIIALAGLFLFPVIRGVKSWYRIGHLFVNPVEFLKIVLIILLAKYFSTRHIEMYRTRHIFLSGLYVAMPVLLIFLQPDLGSVLILILLWLGILLFSKIKLRHFLILVLLGIIIFLLAWSFVFKDYQKQRVLSFISAEFDPLGVGWSQQQSKIAIGSGGIWGQGFGKGSQTQYGFLPEQQTDFVFSVIGEEFGLTGIMVVFILYVFLIKRIIKMSLAAGKNFTRLFGIGFSILLVAHIFVHAGINLGLLPIIGLPLPFISYGGSCLIASFIGLGIVQSFKNT